MSCSLMSLNKSPLRPSFSKRGFKNFKKSSPFEKGIEVLLFKISWPFESFVFQTEMVNYFLRLA